MSNIRQPGKTKTVCCTGKIAVGETLKAIVASGAVFYIKSYQFNGRVRTQRYTRIAEVELDPKKGQS